MHTEPDTQEALIAYLESMKFFYRVEVTDRTSEFAVVYVPAGSIAEVPTGAVVRETPYGRDLFLPREDLESYAEKSGPRPKHPGLRGAARRAPPSPPRLRDRPPHDPARAGLDRHGGPSPEGLLPRPGDGRPRPEPGQAPAPPRLPPPRRQRGPSPGPRHGVEARGGGCGGPQDRLRHHLRTPPRTGPDRPGPGEAERPAGRPAAGRQHGGGSGGRRRALGLQGFGSPGGSSDLAGGLPGCVLGAKRGRNRLFGQTFGISAATVLGRGGKWSESPPVLPVRLAACLAGSR